MGFDRDFGAVPENLLQEQNARHAATEGLAWETRQKDPHTATPNRFYRSYTLIGNYNRLGYAHVPITPIRISIYAMPPWGPSEP